MGVVGYQVYFADIGRVSPDGSRLLQRLGRDWGQTRHSNRSHLKDALRQYCAQPPASVASINRKATLCFGARGSHCFSMAERTSSARASGASVLGQIELVRARIDQSTSQENPCLRQALSNILDREGGSAGRPNRDSTATTHRSTKPCASDPIAAPSTDGTDPINGSSGKRGARSCSPVRPLRLQMTCPARIRPLSSCKVRTVPSAIPV